MVSQLSASEPFALAISSLGLHRPTWILGPRGIINYARAEKQDALGAHVDTQYIALVSHVCAATTKGDSPLEEMSI